MSAYRPNYRIVLAIVALVGISAIAIWGGDDSALDAALEVADLAKKTEQRDSVIRKHQVTASLTGDDVAPTPDRADVAPHRLYQKYLDPAENGDLNAAYVLVTALQQCLHVVRSEEEFTTEIIYQGKSQAVTEAARQNMARCSRLFDILPNVQEEHDRWYTIIRNAKHPLLLVDQRNRPYEESRQLVLSTIGQAYPERHMNRAVFIAASRLYMKYPEVGTDENRFHAWQLLACSVAIRCEHETMREMIVDEFPEARANDIFALEAQLNSSLESGCASCSSTFPTVLESR